jgi:hypothetical protein
MKLVVYSSRTRGFDGQIFVVRTVNSGHKKKERAILAGESDINSSSCYSSLSLSDEEEN